MRRFLVVVLFACPPANAQDASRVQTERGRFWIECQSAPLEEMLREIAALSPMELWLDEGLSEKRVSARVEGATLKQALEEVFGEVKDVNYVLTFDPSNPERVLKVYAGGSGGGRLGREPTVTAFEPEPEEPVENPADLPPELDPEALLGSPEAQDALGVLRDFFEQQKALQNDQDADSSDAQTTDESDLPQLQELLKNLPQFQQGTFTPTPANPAKKEKPKNPR
ncbi:MAG: hypothetical protein ACRD1Z_22865 [Vicinamibacteria bacterium]